MHNQGWEGYFSNVFHYRLQNKCFKPYFVTYFVRFLKFSNLINYKCIKILLLLINFFNRQF